MNSTLREVSNLSVGILKRDNRNRPQEFPVGIGLKEPVSGFPERGGDDIPFKGERNHTYARRELIGHDLRRVLKQLIQNVSCTRELCDYAG